jgi:hypothetical protein
LKSGGVVTVIRIIDGFNQGEWPTVLRVLRFLHV